MAKIVIDAGHGGKDPGAVYQGRQEKDDNLRLALAVGSILQEHGLEVEYTRTTDVYNTPFEKAAMSNNANADFFISIHRDRSTVPNKASGVQTLVYDDSGVKIIMAKNINDELAKLGFTNLGTAVRPNLVVLKRTKMPAILIEVGYIDSDTDNASFDSEFDQIANAIAQGIIKAIGLEATEDSGEEIKEEKLSKMNQSCKSEHKEVLYRVQVGAFHNLSLAEQMVNILKGMGYPAFMIYCNGWYRVQVGAFKILDNAVRMEMNLRQAGYNTLITTE